METHSADTEYLIRKSSNVGYRIFSILTPPAYAAYVLVRHGRGSFSINALLRSTWIGGFVGAAGGAGIAFSRYNFTNAEQVRTKRLQVAYDVLFSSFQSISDLLISPGKIDRIRAEDHATIGGVLFAVLTPALFWNRARIANLILGGAGIGTGVGMMAHWTRSATGDAPKGYSPI
ncbi:hypothetical protein F5878DRAFT_626654 [Lentinula raphanica]|uniref:Uncharacterized protein n=1 Tax=Lentinula raphanica TaxID=153919 RepID=A0AA38P4G7_9AGAR|nr:hypothetical protein F5878DRAFT_626654 [Lentinula raphanica]